MSDNIIPMAPANWSESLPQGFQLRQDGIYFRLSTDKDGDWQRICSPLRVVAISRSPAGTGWGKLIEITNPDRQCQKIFVPSRLLGGDGREVIAMMLDRGGCACSRAGQRAMHCYA